MAKDKKKRRIPKEIAGVKVPKELRQTGEAIIDTVLTRANSPEGKAMIAGGLSMAATALMAAAERQRTKPRAPEPEPEPATASSGNANDPAAEPGQPGTQADRVGEAVHDVVDKLLANVFGRRGA